MTDPGFDGFRVLAVVGDGASLQDLRETLARWGCRAEEAGSDVDALTKLLGSSDVDPYRLILIDGDLPGMGGDQLARAIKASPRHRDIALVRLSATSGPGAGPGTVGGPWSASLAKPARRSRLRNVLRRAFAAPGSPGDQAEAAGRAPARLASTPRVLLAEDNEVNRLVVIGMLDRLGCEVDVVGSGHEVVEAACRGRYDLILMDVQMPEMDGFAATAAIRERERRDGRHVPIVALTAHAMMGDRERCLAAGMDDYLTKPIRPRPLREAILTWAVDDPTPIGSGFESRIRDLGPSRFSTQTLAEMSGEDPALAREILEVTLKEVPGQLDRLAAAVARGDCRQVAWEAHGLKAVFATVGAEPLAVATAELMRLGEDGDLAAIAAKHRPILDLWTGLAEDIRRYLETWTSDEVGTVLATD